MAIPILAYHNISNKFEPGVTRNTIHQFKNQMEWLFRNGYQTITLNDYHAFESKTVSKSSKKTIIITFDDAYESLANAAAIMQEFGFIGCTFAISDYVGRSNLWDYQLLNRKIQHADYKLLKQLLLSGWEVGSHTKTHAFLPFLSDNEIIREIKTSKETLENHLNVSIKSISYPYGKCNAKIRKIAKDMGFQTGVSLGMKKTSQHDLMNLHRVGIYLFDIKPIFQKNFIRTF